MQLPEFLSAEDLEGYAKGAHGGRSGFGEWPAVVVVDFTYAFVDPAHSLAAGDSGLHAVRETRRVLDAARAIGAPVIFTRPTPLTLVSPAAGSISRKRVAAMQAALRQPRGNDLVDELGWQPGELILEKTGASGFFGTDLVKVLIYHRVDTLIVTGAATSGCVRATVVDAGSYNYYVVVPEECVSDRSRVSHQMSLFELDQKYGDVIGVEEVLEYLRERASAPEARRHAARLVPSGA
jgi:nicotinamidase-related amidase